MDKQQKQQNKHENVRTAGLSEQDLLNLARRLDYHDELKGFRDRFYHLEDCLYMDGNSLGLMSVDAEESLNRVVGEWKKMGIRAWTDAAVPWINYGETLGDLSAQFVGAEKGEVVVCGGVTINIHKLVATFYKPEGARRKVVGDTLNFPSDTYALSAQIQLRGGNPEEDLKLVTSRDGYTINEDDVIAALTDDVALCLLPAVFYQSGQLLDVERVAKACQERGIMFGLDCSHSFGALPHKFSEWGVDFAMWCNYKYANGGPGCTGSLYVNKKHWGMMPALAGWWGHERSTMFQMNLNFTPASSASGWQVGTIGIIGTAPIEGGLKIMDAAGMDKIRAKSLSLTRFMLNLLEDTIAKHNFTVSTPLEDERRGGHISLEHEHGKWIAEAMKAHGITPDFRAPTCIRLAPAPLYTRYVDVFKMVRALQNVMDSGEWKHFVDGQLAIVT